VKKNLWKIAIVGLLAPLALVSTTPVAQAATSILALTDTEELVFPAANRVAVVGDGKSNGNIQRYKNVISKNGLSVDAVITTSINTTESTITDYDNPGSASTATGSGNFFQINMNTTASTAVAGGSADFTFAFYEAGTYTGPNTGIPVILQNVRMTSIDLDTSGTGGYQYTDFTGFQKYSMTNPTNLSFQALTSPSRTRFIAAKTGARSSVPEDQVMVRYDAISQVTITVGNPIQSTTNYYGVTFGGWPNGGTPVEQTNAFNVPPTSTSETLRVPSGTATVIQKGSFGSFADADGNPFVQIRIGAIPGSGSLQYFNGSSWTNVTAGQVISVADIELGKLRFTGTSSTSFTFAVYDGLDYSLSNYTLSLTVVANSQTITFANPGTKAPSATFASAATASSSLTVTLTSNTTGVCTVSGLDITTVTSGTCSITATQLGDATYGAAAPVTQVFPVSSLTAQTITFNNPGSKTMSSTPFASNATASSSLTVTLVSNTPSVCTVSGLNIVMVSPGTCSITANQPGDGTRAPAPSVTQDFLISAGAPTVVTQDATSISGTGATLNGTVNSYSLSATTTFCWGSSATVSGSGSLSSCTSTSATPSPITSASATSASKAITGLTSGNTYYFQIVAVTSSGTAYGSVKSFVASSSAAATAPTAKTLVVSTRDKTSATLPGTVTPNGSAVTSIRFCITTNSANTSGVLTSSNCSYKTASPSTLTSTASATNVSASATSLSTNTLYYYQVIAVNGIGTTYGEIKQFYTLDDNSRVLKAVTNAASSISSTAATLNGAGRSNSTKNSASLKFCWGTSSTAVLGELSKSICTLVSASPSSTKTTDTDVSTTYSLTGLQSGTTYYFQAITSRTSSSVTRYGYGEILSFTTSGAVPSVQTLGATAVAGTSATLNGTVNPSGNSTTIAFCYGTSSTLSGCTTATSTTPASATGTSSVAARADIGGLISGTKYYFRVSGTNASGTSNGSILNFIAGTPTAITLSPSEITGTSATLNGAIKANGITTTTGICWGTSATVSAGVLSTCTVVTPTPSSVESTTATTTGVTYSLSGLTAGTTYYYQVRATGNGGTNNGEVRSFVASSAPTVTTSSATSITSTGATVNGSVNAQGASTLNLFCLSDTNTVSDGYLDSCSSTGFYEATPTSSTGGGNTAISLALTGLNPGTTYYFQAVGDNARGTTPGSVLSFKTSSAAPVATTAKPTVSGLSATFKGSAIANGDTTTVTFIYSLANTVNGSGALSSSPITATPTSNVISEVDGLDLTAEYAFETSTALTAGTTFYYQIKATNANGTAYGAVESVIVGSPTVVTSDPSSISSSGATLNGTSNANGANSNNYLVWGTSPDTDADGNLATVTTDTATVGATSSGSSPTNIAISLTGLTQGQIYYYQAKATNSRGTSYGAIKSFAAGKKAQTIDFSALTGITYGDPAPQTVATTTSGLPETYTVSSGPCSITEAGELTITGAGDCVIYAHQAGGEAGGFVWDAATSVTRTLVISAKPLKIKASSHVVGLNSTNTIPYSATYVSFAPGETEGNLTGTLSCTSASLNRAVAGDYDSLCSGFTSNNYSITYETGTVTVTSKTPQTITFAPIGNKTYQRSSESLTATTDSGLTITYTVSGNCSLTPPDTLVITGAGTCTVTASQAGNSTYETAVSITRTITIDPAPLSITASSHTVSTGTPVTISATYSGFVSSETIADLSGSLTCSTTYSITSAAGTYVTTCSGFTSSNYTITYVDGTVVASGSTPPSGSSSTTSKVTSSTTIVKKTAFATLVTLGTKKVTTTITTTKAPEVEPKPSASATPKPSASATPKPSASATPKPSASATPKPSASATPNPSSTPEPKPTPTKPTEVTPVTFVSKNLQSVVLVGEELSVVAKPGYSGITKVVVEVENGGEIERIATTVTVLPLPAVAPTVKVSAAKTTTVTWQKSPNATMYEVTDEDGNTLCTTIRTSCRVNTAIAPNESVEIVALGRDNLVSEPVAAVYVPKAAPKPAVPVAEVVVNFATNQYSLTTQEKRELDAFIEKVKAGGFKELDISGHTDSVGGVDNNVLSLNRAKETRAYILKEIPDLKITLGGYADAVAVASNATAAGKAANRRAEVRIIK
jgi:outer membrane protein OmpA-like peptidoglycan-associated protein/phosphodiesterase/alkaline phosphatase D-like protein